MKRDKHYLFDLVPYTIVRSHRRKRSEISLGPEGVKISVPFDRKDQEIWDMIELKERWIVDNYLEFQAKKKDFSMQVDRSYVLQRIEELAPQMGVTPSKVVIKHLKTRWGSAALNGTITINSRIFRAPKDVVDYIIIHELCHLKIHNHYGAYWSMVGTHMPEYEEKIRWLEENGRFL